MPPAEVDARVAQMRAQSSADGEAKKVGWRPPAEYQRTPMTALKSELLDVFQGQGWDWLNDAHDGTARRIDASMPGREEAVTRRAPYDQLEAAGLRVVFKGASDLLVSHVKAWVARGHRRGQPATVEEALEGAMREGSPQLADEA